MSSAKVVGKVTYDERDIIKRLNDRKLSLRDLALTLADAGIEDTNHLYNRLVEDMSNTQNAIKLWWSEMAQKYKWEGSNWNIIFNSCEVLLNEHN